MKNDFKQSKLLFNEQSNSVNLNPIELQSLFKE
jgi:hypothetical protein